MKKLMKLALIMLMALVVLMTAKSVKATETEGTGGETNPGTSEETPGEDEENPPTEGDGDDETDGDEEEPAELTWTESSKVKLTLSSKDSGYGLKVRGLNDGGHYYVYISNTTKPEVKKDTDGKPSEATYSDINVNDNDLPISKYFALKGEVYVTLVEAQYDVKNAVWQTKEIISGRQLPRPELAKVGGRLQCFFLNESTSAFVKDPIFFSTSEGRNVKIKIGTVTDKEVLKAIKNKESDSLSKLLTYAKNAKSTYTGTIPVGKSRAIAPGMKLTNDAYYYVYMELEDKNGTYYPVEDVSLYQAIVGPTVGSYLTDYLSEDFKWNLDEESQKPNDKVEEPKKDDKKDDTVIPDKKLPQTGQTLIGLGIGATVLALGIVFAIKSKKYSI